MNFDLIAILISSSFVSAYSHNGNYSEYERSIEKSSFDGTSQPEFNVLIMNGNTAEPNAYQFQVFLQINVSRMNTKFCGGTLLTQRYVLTAGHCGQGANGGYALMGAHNLSTIDDTMELVKIRRIKVHEKFNTRTILNDIALFELDCPVPLRPNIQTVKLPPRSYVRKDLKNKNATTVGWGFTKGSSASLSPVLQEVTDKILPPFDCWIKFPTLVKNTHICLNGKQGKASCNGDSGGPLLFDGYQVGITSFGARGCKFGYPTVFTRITSYLNWIELNSDYKVAK